MKSVEKSVNGPSEKPKKKKQKQNKTATKQKKNKNNMSIYCEHFVASMHFTIIILKTFFICHLTPNMLQLWPYKTWR